MESAPIIQRFITQMPVKFSVEMNPPFWLGAVVIVVDQSTGHAISIKRLTIIDDAPAVEIENVQELGGW